MNIFLDTATSDFILILFDNNFKIMDKIFIQGYKKKVDLIVEQFKLILERNNLQTSNIHSFYTNLGPGFFTGVRASLIYLRTIALFQKQKFYTTNSFEILKIANNLSCDMILDAQGGKVFVLKSEDFGKDNYINLVSVHENNSSTAFSINYEYLVENFKKFKHIFKEEKNLLGVTPFYIKKPQIGAKK